MSFFNELKRRNVVKVGIAYGVVAWLLMQVMDTVFPRLGVPGWAISALMVLLILGLPVALVLAWVFEMTPGGITTQEAVDAGAKTTSGRKLNALIIGALSLAVAFLVIDNYVLDAPAESAETAALVQADVADQATDPFSTGFDIPEKSLAVLPFDDLSPDMDQEYFSDGLTEELINKLSQVNDLLVTGRNSSFYFKGRNDDLFEIGQKLGVAHVLQGSVRKAGNQLRVSAQLMDVSANANIWSQTFDRQLDDIFAIQDEIAEAVTTALSVTLNAGEFNRLGMTSNVEAYDEILQAQRLRGGGSFPGQSILDALGHAERAVQIDPSFALGWVQLALAYNTAYIQLPPDQTSGFVNRRESAIDRARALEPEMNELKYEEASRLSRIEQQYAEADAILQELLADSSGSNSIAAALYSQLLWVNGRTGEALGYAQQARRLEPQGGGFSALVGYMLLNLNRLDDFQDELKRAQTLENPQNLPVHRLIAAMMTGDKNEVLRVIESTTGLNPMHARLSTLWANEGDAATLALLHEMNDAGNLSNNMQTILREWAAVLGDPELGLELLNQQELTSADIWLPLYSDIRKLPGFKDYVRREGLLDYWLTTGQWSDFCRPLEGNDDFECF